MIVFCNTGHPTAGIKGNYSVIDVPMYAMLLELQFPLLRVTANLQK
jgi:hypothetical protein